MYPNLKAEFARRNFTLEKIVEIMKERGRSMSLGTLSSKMRGLFPFTYDEAIFIKNDVLETDIPLEVLFERVV